VGDRPVKGASVLVLALLAVLFVTGCPLEAPFPLGEPGSGSLDPALAGRWGWSEPKSGEEGEFEFTRFNAGEYVVLGREKGKDVTLLYRIFTTKVEAASYLNISELQPGPERSFLFARYSVKGDELSLRIVEEKEVPKVVQTDPTGLVKFLASRPDVPTPDGEPLVLRRLPKVLPKSR
jgi:hypothetical protein